MSALTAQAAFPAQAIAWAPQAGSQTLFLSCPVFECLYEGTRGPGKGLPLSALVYTPAGPRAIGTLRVGDEVCSPLGGRSRVAGVFPQGVRPCYRIRFRDGRETVCDDQHRWRVKNGSGWVVWSMPQLLAAWQRPGRKQSYYVPTTMPLEHDAGAELPVDPYLLGLLLGDGAFRKDGSVSYCTVDDELAREVVRHGFREVAKDKRNSVRYFTLSKKHVLYSALDYLLLTRRGAQLKAVPARYLLAGPAARLALLRGLMDTDGSSSGKDSTCEFGSSSRQLALDVQRLAWSLGALATYSSPHALRHRVLMQFGNRVQPFALPRKLKRRSQNDAPSLRIESIEVATPQETVCIRLDSKDGLFVTDQYVVTHNTDALLISFARFTGQGYGAAWRGVLFRETYPQLSDVIVKSKKLFPRIWPQAKYNESTHTWTWPDGEQLLFRHMRVEADYWDYHGHAYPWIGWEELTNWANDACYKLMFSCCRSDVPGMPRMVRATANPYGVGHNWVKLRWRLPASRGRITKTPGEPDRVAIHGRLEENRILLRADPDYVSKLRASARNANELKAWLHGDWDIVAGGMLDDVWEPRVHVLPNFPLQLIPRGWRIDRSFDWGSSHPFSVGWWAESNGEPIEWEGRLIGEVRGDLIRLEEWYGWTGKPNEGVRMLSTEVALGIREREDDFGLRGRVYPGPADSSIFDKEDGHCIADDMRKKSVSWLPADKKAGSRKQGWEQIRKRLKGAKRAAPGLPREEPGLFVRSSCEQFLRTVPVLPRSDKDLDDVDTDAEDHIGDDTRYRVRHTPRHVQQGNM